MNTASNIAPGTTRSEESASEAANSPDRSRIRAVLTESEEVPITQPSPGQESIEDKKSLIELAGTSATYHGQMIPNVSGNIHIRKGGNGGLSLDLDFVAKNGTKLRGYIHTDDYGKGAIITDSNVGLNNYFRHRYPNEAQDLANELIAQFQVLEID